ncbi:MAG: glycosyltransferase [Patescibacteria group bacterium]
MKILYIAMKYDYGNPKSGYGFEHYNFYDSLVKMENHKNQVTYFPFDEIMIKYGKNEMNKMLLKVAQKENPDLCFFFLFEDQIKKETIREITSKNKMITFNWFADDQWRFKKFSKYWAPLFNWVSTTDESAIKKYQNISYKNVIKTQWACNHFLYEPNNDKKKYDITFVGQVHGNREKIIKKIRKRNVDVECWGNGWNNGRVSQEKMIEIFCRSKINLNFADSSVATNWKTIARLFASKKNNKIKLYKPKEWVYNLNSIFSGRKKQIKGRNFEIPGGGSFLLTSQVGNLNDYYDIGKEIVTFKNVDELVYKANYFLKNEKEREKIAQAGYKRTLKDHTYEKRFIDIFKTIGLYK